MKINDNGITRDMTPEEESEYITMQSTKNFSEEEKYDEALKSFFEALADNQTNTIAKIRNLAQQFIDNTN